jgi:polygalacturonase
MTNILDYGAVSGSVSNTRAIQAAIDACAAAGGGTVFCPAGAYRTGTLWLKSHVTLHLENGCVLEASTDRNEYNAVDCFVEQDQVAHQNANGTHLIIAYKVSHVGITGEGRINGNSSAFFTEGEHEHPNFPGHFVYKMPEERPGQMLYFCRCQHVRLHDLAMDNACFWTVYMLGCEDVSVRGVSIDVKKVPNGDGLHFNCCRNVKISDCTICSQDDCLVFRGYEEPLGKAMPCENVVVSNCLLQTFCCGIRIGVGNGVVRNCHFSDLVIHDTRHGINIMPAYSERYSRGTDLDNITFNGITMDVMTPIYASNPGMAQLRNINFANLNVNMTQPAVLMGDASNCYEDIAIRDSRFNLRAGLQHRSGLMYPDATGCCLYGKHLLGLTCSDFWKLKPP